jgi:hypothetical protein
VETFDQREPRHTDAALDVAPFTVDALFKGIEAA